jgi:hypothetical protein
MPNFFLFDSLLIAIDVLIDQCFLCHHFKLLLPSFSFLVSLELTAEFVHVCLFNFFFVELFLSHALDVVFLLPVGQLAPMNLAHALILLRLLRC